jgi:hypothetical protein
MIDHQPDHSSKRPPKAVQASSGEHPAVQAYRAKLESVDEGASAATTELDKALQEFLTALKTPVPNTGP